jgi:hypothetical protein
MSILKDLSKVLKKSEAAFAALDTLGIDPNKFLSLVNARGPIPKLIVSLIKGEIPFNDPDLVTALEPYFSRTKKGQKILLDAIRSQQK